MAFAELPWWIMKRTPLRRMSKKRKAQIPLRKKVIEEVMDRDRGLCQAALPGLCRVQASDVHEILTRARGGSILDPDNCIALCRPCHSWITDHPGWSRDHGFMISSWTSGAEVIAASRAREVWLHGPRVMEEFEDEETA